MCNQGLIECHTCGQRVTLVRSVRIRGDTEHEFDLLLQRFPNLGELTPGEMDEYMRAYVRYARNSTHRRAFICLACYAKLDNYWGSGFIERDERIRRYDLSGDCRGDRAAVYDYGKWTSYQARKLRESLG